MNSYEQNLNKILQFVESEITAKEAIIKDCEKTLKQWRIFRGNIVLELSNLILSQHGLSIMCPLIIRQETVDFITLYNSCCMWSIGQVVWLSAIDFGTNRCTIRDDDIRGISGIPLDIIKLMNPKTSPLASEKKEDNQEITS